MGQRSSSPTNMCGDPCIKSVCGLSLQKSVTIIGIIELVITVLVTIANVVKHAKLIDTDSFECEGKDICIGPIIKYCVFDAFFGVLCALLLIFGASRRSRCLLIFWIIITACCSVKYIVIFCMNDWTSLEDWISIVYLLFYTTVFLIVISFMKETNGSGGIVHGGGAYGAPPPYKA